MALSFPPSPTPDQIYTVGDQSWKWNGTSWEAAASAEVAPPVYINSHPPTSPQAGCLWWDSDTGELYAGVPTGGMYKVPGSGISSIRTVV
jgi:hypothetical protein